MFVGEEFHEHLTTILRELMAYLLLCRMLAGMTENPIKPKKRSPSDPPPPEQPKNGHDTVSRSRTTS
jgi:hypothetical protein